MTTIKTETMTGDAWRSQCGTVTLYCAACKDVLPSIAGVDAVVTDPPYALRPVQWDVAP